MTQLSHYYIGIVKHPYSSQPKHIKIQMSKRFEMTHIGVTHT